MTRSFPGYRLLDRLHNGRTTVFRGIRLSDQTAVICKIIDEAPSRAADCAGLRREYAILTRLDAPTVPRGAQLIDDGATLMLVYDDIGGASLDQLYRDGPMALGPFLDMAIALTAALATLHGAGLVHKDIAPANIIWNPESAALNLIDFGIASELVREECLREAVETMKGTLAYMAPEQTGRMNRAVDYRVDFYAAGASFYHLLTGRPPFTTADPLDLVHSHVARAAEPVHRVNPAVPPALSAIIARLMVKDPEDRYQSSFGLRCDLELCRTQLATSAAIASFDLAQQDRRPVLRMPQRLYAREAERRALLNAFNALGSAGPQLVLISGQSGVGKSALVTELQAPVAAARGVFLSGKFEVLRHDMPYAPIIQAMGDLFRRVSGGGPRSEAWAARIRAALGDEAAVISMVIPDLERLIGCPPAVPELGPSDAQNRFISVFRKLFAALPAEGVVLFLDDLQWADLSSLKLLHALATDSALGHLLILGAYPDIESGLGQPLRTTVESIKAAGANLHMMRLSGLDLDAVTRLLADCLGVPGTALGALAAELYAKTLGNPLFLGQVLDTLARSKLIVFDQLAGTWSWDLDGIRALPIGDGLVGLVMQRIRALPSDTLETLCAASCIGSVFSLAALAAALDCAPSEAAIRLWPALLAGMVLPQGDGYRVAAETDRAADAIYRFVHDRVEGLAYSLLPDATAMAYHLAIARWVQRRAGDGAAPFDLVYHLNRAAPLLLPAERDDLARHNLNAGRAARAASAFGPALTYFQTGLKHLPADGWTRLYPLSLALHLEAAELAVWANDEAVFSRLIGPVRVQARTMLDRVSVLEIDMQSAFARHRNDEALHLGRKALALLGAPLPRTITKAHVILELARSKFAVRGKSDEVLATWHRASTPTALAIGRILSQCSVPAYLSDPDLYTLVTCLRVRLAMSLGLDQSTPIAFASFGILLAASGDLAGALKFGRAALRLGQRLGGYPRSLVLFKSFIEIWHRPLGEIIPTLIEVAALAERSGDFTSVGMALASVMTQQLSSGTPLPAVSGSLARYREILETTHQQTYRQNLITHQQFVADLMAPLPPSRLFAGPFATEALALSSAEAGDWLAVALIYNAIATLNLLFGRLDAARHYANLLSPHLIRLRAILPGARAAALKSIIDFACWDRLDLRQRRQALRANAKIDRRLVALAAFEPTNFAALHALLRAERERAMGKPDSAMALYAAAIEAARAQDFHDDQALAAERAGDLALARGRREDALDLFRQSRAAFERWGSVAKVADLGARIAGLAPDLARTPAEPRRADPTRPGSGDIDALDISTILRAGQALSENLRLPDLLQTLMRLVLANAGATHGYLLLETDGAWHIEAAASADAEGVEVLQSQPLAGSPVPLSIIEQATGSLEPIVFSDATSVVCLPLRNRSRLNGLLYLENRLAAGVFSPERVQLLNLISAQIAISIENARLYDRLAQANQTLESQVAQRTAELKLSLNQLRMTQSQLLQQEKRAAIGRLTAGIAHEIQNPLNFINNFASLSQDLVAEIASADLAFTAESREALELLTENMRSIAAHGTRAAGIVRGMLAHSRTGTGSTAPADIGRLLRDSLAQVTGTMPGRAQAAGVAIVWRLEPDLPQPVLDPVDIGTVLTNLIRNAVYALDVRRADGEPDYRPVLTLTARAADGVLEILVHDNGTGIPKAAQAHLFTPFFTTKPSGAGTGLGLSLCFDIIARSYGGDLSIRSVEGGFTEAIVTLPLSLAD